MRYVMTVQRGTAPKVDVSGSALAARVTIGKQTIHFDGEKLVIGPQSLTTSARCLDSIQKPRQPCDGHSGIGGRLVSSLLHPSDGHARLVGVRS
jgi:hypothetical protein